MQRLPVLLSAVVLACTVFASHAAAQTRTASQASTPPAAQQSSAFHPQAVRPDARALHTRLVPALSPVASQKIQTAAKAITTQVARGSNLSATSLQVEAHDAGMRAFPAAGQPDIDAATFLILMQAADNQEKELQSLSDQMQKDADQKKALRTPQPKTTLSAGQPSQPGDMSTQQQMLLQNAMDRRSKLMEAISDIMKKVSSTSDSVVKNLK